MLREVLERDRLVSGRGSENELHGETRQPKTRGKRQHWEGQAGDSPGGDRMAARAGAAAGLSFFSPPGPLRPAGWFQGGPVSSPAAGGR